MRQRILTKHLTKPINKTIGARIDKRMVNLKKEFQDKWSIHHTWDTKNTKKTILTITADAVTCEIFFFKNKVEVFVEAPFYLVPFLEPFRKKAIQIIEKELATLIV